MLCADIPALTRAIRAGDPAALSALYLDRFPRLLALAHHLTTRDESFCLDAVQDAFLRIAARLPVLDSPAALDAYLARTLRSVIIDQLRREVARAKADLRTTSCPPAPALQPAPTPASSLAAAERLAWLRAELAALSSAETAALHARFLSITSPPSSTDHPSPSRHAAWGRLRRVLARLRAAARTAFPESSDAD